jgi:protein TonB
MRKKNIVKLCIFLAIAGLHGALLFVTFTLKSSEVISSPETQVMKLTNFDEEIPPPVIPPPQVVPPTYQNTVENIADVMEETDEPIEEIEISTEPIPRPVIVAESEEYLPMHRISVPPVFSEQELRQRIVYPVIALRSGIEGTVFLELFVDKSGVVQNIVILKEDPVDRGFGEAAVKAFQGFRCTPAQANGVPVAVRYRYPLRFVVR